MCHDLRGGYRHPSRRLNGGCEDEYVSQSYVAAAAAAGAVVVVAPPVDLARYAHAIVHALCLESASLRQTLRPSPYRTGKTWCCRRCLTDRWDSWSLNRMVYESE